MTLDRRWLATVMMAVVLGAMGAISARATPADGGALEAAPEACATLGALDIGEWAKYRKTTEEGTSSYRFARLQPKASGDDIFFWHELAITGHERDVILQLLTPTHVYAIGEATELILKDGDKPAQEFPYGVIVALRNGNTFHPPIAFRRCDASQVIGWETVTVPAGEFRACHFRSNDAAVDFWLSPDVPFGLVKSVSKYEGELALSATGTGATSSIDETPIPAVVPGSQ